MLRRVAASIDPRTPSNARRWRSTLFSGACFTAHGIAFLAIGNRWFGVAWGALGLAVLVDGLVRLQHTRGAR